MSEVEENEVENEVENKPRAANYLGFSPNAKIYLRSDEEGKKYGPKNNPRLRKGGKETFVAANFAKMRDGMTIKQARDLGIPSGSINKCYQKNWIDLEEPEEVEAAETAETAE